MKILEGKYRSKQTGRIVIVLGEDKGTVYYNPEGFEKRLLECKSLYWDELYEFIPEEKK